MTGRADDDAVAAWRDDGWVLVEGLVEPGEIDTALADLYTVFPTAERYHADPRERPGPPVVRPRRCGVAGRSCLWPAPRSAPSSIVGGESSRSRGPARSTGSWCTRRSSTSSRALETEDLRLYQAQVTAKYAGDANYEQPLHTDRNHSFLPPRMEAPWWHVETFLYLSDVDAGTAPTHLVPRRGGANRSVNDAFGPGDAPELYASERGAPGPRGSLLAYRPDVFHRAVDLTEPRGARFLLNVSFKVAGQDWIGYHSHAIAGEPSGVGAVR